MFKQLFKKFPGLHSEMLAESFSRYIREFRKPCGRRRTETIKKLNSKKQYSTVNLDSNKEDGKKAIVKIEDKKDGKDIARAQIIEKQEQMKSYKGKLELINHSANEMFEQMKAIYKLVNGKIVEIERGVT